MIVYRIIALASFVMFVACRDATPSSPPSDPSASRKLYPGISAALTLDPYRLENYANPTLPAYLTRLQDEDNTPRDNAVTDAGATLGRVLFFDRQLSINGQASCASCHLASASLGDTLRFSIGFAGAPNTRVQSMRLFNLRFFKPGLAFWDKRAASLEDLAMQPIRDSIELGFTDAVGGVDSLLKRMRSLPYYPELFSIAFGDSAVTETGIRRALAQYLRSIVSRDSRFDRAAQSVQIDARTGQGDFRPPFPTFTAEENLGKHLFLNLDFAGGAGCFACHSLPAFSFVTGSRGNGLDAGETRLFRAPSLKGVATSRHFMHDGRFSTLEQVVEFYNSGVQEAPSLDDRMRGPTGAPQRLRLSAEEKAALVAFMRTLTDESTANESRFRSPFRR